MLLAGDIGGTKTLLALYAPATGARQSVVEAEFHSADYPGLDVMAREFLAREKLTADHACFDVAGPVIAGRAHLTNLPWDVEEAALCQALGLRRVMLLNDLKAIAYAVPHLQPEDLHSINVGKAEPQGPIAVVAPGTGLGEAFLVWGGSSYIACSSEGGHASFPPTDERQAGLWQYLANRFGHVSCERVCSGLGIANIYDYLRNADPGAEPDAFAATLARAHDRTPLIAQAGLEDPSGNPLAAATLEIFVSILGDEASNLALKVLATGGVYLAGGIPIHVLPKLTDGRFMRAFVNKGRLSDLLAAMPVHVVMTRAALLGAAQYGLDQMQTA
ncbi:MAG TPA: glucokinase [Acetobacteraceae bacterium]|jgi:glucokinase|nr:glucokinase [Acetobacteraceae bacterium]